MYICSVCQKSYENNRAYGGHVSSHNRKENYKKGRKKKEEKEKPNHECKFCNKIFKSGFALGGHVNVCKLNPNSRLESFKSNMRGKKMKEATKLKLSTSMKRAHEEGRAWNIGNNRKNRKQSWPEEFFENFLKNNDIQYRCEVQISVFSIDFVVGENIAIEIDGKQHENEDQKKRDHRKNLLLKEKGWKLLRVKWVNLYNDTKPVLEKILEWIKNPTEYKEI